MELWPEPPVFPGSSQKGRLQLHNTAKGSQYLVISINKICKILVSFLDVGSAVFPELIFVLNLQFSSCFANHYKFVEINDVDPVASIKFWVIRIRAPHLS